MTSVLLLVLLFVGAISTGLAVGKSLKRFFIGLGITTLCTLPFVLSAGFNSNEFLIALSSGYGNGTDFFPGLFTVHSVPAALTWGLILFFALLAIFVYVAIFNCRKNAENIYIALAGTVAVGLVLYFCSVWGFYGLSTLFSFSGNTHINSQLSAGLLQRKP